MKYSNYGSADETLNPNAGSGAPLISSAKPKSALNSKASIGSDSSFCLHPESSDQSQMLNPKVKFEANASSENLRKIHTSELLIIIRTKAKAEQALTLEVIDLIQEVNRRKIYLNLGYSSLFEFVVSDLKYEPSTASRRIGAARLVAEIPEVRAKIEDGSLSLSVVSQAQSFFRKDETKTEEKKEILKSLENKTTREAEKELIRRKPEAITYYEKRRELTEEFTEIKIVIDQQLKADMDELKLLLSHANPNLTDVGLLRGLVTAGLKKYRKPTKAKVKSSTQCHSPVGISQKSLIPQADAKTLGSPRVRKDANCGAVRSGEDNMQFSFSAETNILSDTRPARSRHIPSTLRMEVYLRDGGKCQFVSPVTGRKCGGEYKVQVDHIQRFADGGSHSLENLRLLCRAHNHWRG